MLSNKFNIKIIKLGFWDSEFRFPINEFSNITNIGYIAHAMYPSECTRSRVISNTIFGLKIIKNVRDYI